MRSHMLGRVLALTVVLSGGRVAAAADPPRSDGIALTPIDVSGVNVSREDLESAVMKGLAIAGRPVVNAEDTAARAAESKLDLACQSAQCWSRLGTLTNARWVVSGSAAREGNSFKVHFKLVSTKNGVTMGTEDNECEVADCSVAELARRSARELVRQTLGRASDEEAAVDPVPPVVVTPTPPVVHAKDEPPPPPRRRWVWPVLAGVGAASVAAGAYFIAADGSHVPGFRPEATFTHGLLWGLVAVGGGVALGGVSTYFILRDAGDGGAQMAVQIGPGSLSLNGRF